MVTAVGTSRPSEPVLRVDNFFFVSLSWWGSVWMTGVAVGSVAAVGYVVEGWAE